jgi:ribosomal 50S subunit-recycling heat shock protein
MMMRLDKFMKVSRLIKRRTLAKDVSDQGRIEVNGRVAKPGTELKVGDLIRLNFGSRSLVVRVTRLANTTRKEDAQEMYEVVEEIRML